MGKIGVRAESARGRALDVLGRAFFTTSGHAVLKKGSRTKTVKGVAMGSKSVVMVTPQGSPGSGVVVHYVKKASSSSFTVVLSDRAEKCTRFGWFKIT